jgi:ParB family chromosome partitioning protein
MNMIPLEDIVVGKRLRQIRQESVDLLAGSIGEVGLMNPIVVSPILDAEGEETGMFRLIAGNHRLEAYKQLGKTEIPAAIGTGSDVDQRLAEIDENLCRAELTHLERAEHLAERKFLYEIIHPETKKGTAGAHAANRSMGRRNSQTNQSSFATDTAKRIRKTERCVQEAVRRANNISQEIRDSIRDVASIADNSLELDALASLEESEQKAAVRAVLDGKARSIRDVVRQKEESIRPQVSTSRRPNKDESDDPDSFMAELEDWKRRALEAEERCIYLGHQLEEINADPVRQRNRGAALKAMLDEMEGNLATDPGAFQMETLNTFESRFSDLVFLIKSVKRR